MLRLHRTQPSPDIRPGPESIYLLQSATQAASQFLTVSTGGGQGIPGTALYCIMLQPYFQAADAMLYKSQCLGRAGKAGPGRTELPSAASTHAEGLAGPNVTYSTGQNTSWAGELLSGFTLPESSLPHPKAVSVFLLPYLQ